MSPAKDQVAPRELTNDVLRGITTADEAMRLIAEINQSAPIQIGEVLGNGFEVLPNERKNQLESEPFVIIDWRFYKGEKGPGMVVALMIVTKAGRKLIINDGSTGIRDQVTELDKSGVRAPVVVPNGLKSSNYDYTNPDTGEVSRATTFYLDTSS